MLPFLSHFKFFRVLWLDNVVEPKVDLIPRLYAFIESKQDDLDEWKCRVHYSVKLFSISQENEEITKVGLLIPFFDNTNLGNNGRV